MFKCAKNKLLAQGQPLKSEPNHLLSYAGLSYLFTFREWLRCWPWWSRRPLQCHSDCGIFGVFISISLGTGNVLFVCHFGKWEFPQSALFQSSRLVCSSVVKSCRSECQTSQWCHLQPSFTKAAPLNITQSFLWRIKVLHTCQFFYFPCAFSITWRTAAIEIKGSPLH